MFPTLLKKRLWLRCFPINFQKFLRTSVFIEHIRWLFLQFNQIYWLCQKIPFQGVWWFYFCTFLRDMVELQTVIYSSYFLIKENDEKIGILWLLSFCVILPCLEKTYKVEFQKSQSHFARKYLFFHIYNFMKPKKCSRVTRVTNKENEKTW